VRLHKLLAHAGVASRRAAETLIADGRVSVNGQTVTQLGTQADPAHDEVRVDGLLAQVRLRVGHQSLTAVITADALDALKLRRGDDAIAVIKSTEVMIATPAVAAAVPPRRSRPTTQRRR